jgi:hypothetical protein
MKHYDKLKFHFFKLLNLGYNCQAFAVNVTKTEDCKPAMLANGKIRYVECLINNQDTVEAKVKKGFVYSGKIINSIAIVYFKDQGKTYYLTLNGKKAPGGALRETDMNDQYRELTFPEALGKAALREFAEEMLALDKKQAKEMDDSQIVKHIRKTTECKEPIECRILINKKLERIPQKEFNDLMLSVPTMIDLATCSLETMQKALVKEEGKNDVPQIIDEEAALNPKEFRNASQVAFHKVNPEIGIGLMYFWGEPN